MAEKVCGRCRKSFPNSDFRIMSVGEFIQQRGVVIPTDAMPAALVCGDCQDDLLMLMAEVIKDWWQSSQTI